MPIPVGWLEPTAPFAKPLTAAPAGAAKQAATTLRGINFISTTNGWVVGSNGTLLKTTDGGTNWNALTSGTTNDLYDVQFTDANTGWVVGENGTIRKTTNGGTSWTAQTSGTTQDLYGLYFVDANTGWAVGNNGVIRKTTNGGTTWTAQSSGITERLNEVFFTTATNGWAVGDNGVILYTADGGTTWTGQAANTNQDINSVYFVSGSNGWAVGNNGDIETFLLSVLPANFTSFEASSTDCSSARLQWQTASEINNNRFEVQWSTDGSNWQTVGSVNASTAFTYSLTYTGLAQGVNYFRLKQVDHDGRYAFSKLITVSKSCGVAGEVSVYPNPTRSSVTVQIGNTSLLGTQARLVNMQGHVLRQFTITNVKEPLHLTGLPAGTYFLITASKQSFRIIKQ
jgi:hypothetical protein